MVRLSLTPAIPTEGPGTTKEFEMASFQPIRILVLHEDPVAQVGLSAALSRHSGFDVLEADDRGTAMGCLVARPGERPVDVVVADYGHGVAVASDVKRRLGDGAVPRVVIVTATDREWEIRSALEHGVRGYLLTGCSLQELAEAVRAVQRGARHLSTPVVSRLAESMSLEPLTMREEEVLRLVLEGLCNKAIGRRLGIAVGTVKSHLKASFGKLGVDSRTQAMAAVERRGLLRTPAPSLFNMPEPTVSANSDASRAGVSRSNSMAGAIRSDQLVAASL
jgi:DNA-binding NarL/FixJ family response regulator